MLAMSACRAAEVPAWQCHLLAEKPNSSMSMRLVQALWSGHNIIASILLTTALLKFVSKCVSLAMSRRSDSQAAGSCWLNHVLSSRCCTFIWAALLLSFLS